MERVNLATKRALGSLVGKVKEVGGFSYNIYTYLYNTLIAPTADYCSCVWGFNMYDSLETTQNNAMREVLSRGGQELPCGCIARRNSLASC